MNTSQMILLISLGAIIGANVRYGISLWIAAQGYNAGWPLATFLINASGSFLLGLLVAVNEQRTLVPPSVMLTLGVGLLGAFTTFSTFSVETWHLWRGGDPLTALAYAFGSVLAGFGGVALAFWLVTTCSK